MSLSRNGTLEKTISERGSPSRAGSGVVVPPPYSLGGSEAADGPLELRGSLDCWACSVLVTAQNMIIALINATLASIVFGVILTPALVMIIFGFLCHSTVRSPLETSVFFSFSGWHECQTESWAPLPFCTNRKWCWLSIKLGIQAGGGEPQLCYSRDLILFSKILADLSGAGFLIFCSCDKASLVLLCNALWGEVAYSNCKW